MRSKLQALVYVIAPVMLTLAPQVARPADPPKVAPSAQPAAPSGEDKAERVNVENIKQKYWARGDESEIGVVQNRLYSKNGRFELGVLGSILTTDPFFSVSSLGGSLGYHFSEYVSVHAIGWKTFVKPSAAYDAFQENITS
ncbi:MAG TPA: hypothetical protein VM598_01360, partial [Bdellovibrionota bacterium]|nr:hypothetical protein [Bdellovibrionota bacterium]